MQLFFFFKMAARERKEKGFYASLNSVSSIDMLPKVRNRKIKERGTFLGSRESHR